MKSTRDVHLFVNKFAGRGKAAVLGTKISERLARNGLRVQVAETTSPAGLIAQVARACQQGVDKLLIAGGDGSVNEAINGIMTADANPRLGVIPIGTGNDFAKAVRIPLDWQPACDRIAGNIEQAGLDARIDVGRCDERYFLNGLGIGFDAKVATTASRMQWPSGQSRYPLALARTLFGGIDGPMVRLVAGESVLETRITLISIMNGQVAGGVFPLAPDARIDDGLFDIVVADSMNRRQVIRLLPRLMKGTHLSLPAVKLIRARALILESSTPLPVQADGEILSARSGKLDIELYPGRLSVIGGRVAG